MSYETEEDNLIDELNNGDITQKEFNQAMRELNQEMRDMAQERADRARQDFYDYNGY